MPIKSRHALLFLSFLLPLPFTSGNLFAQASGTSTLDFATGSDFEDYLRVLQVAGIEPLQPWSIRAFSPRDIIRMVLADSAGPWALRKNFHNERLFTGRTRFGSTINTSFPYGANDGPVWAGRGITLVASAGVGGVFGPLSFSISPTAFIASNAAFTLIPNGQSGTAAYANGSFPLNVDYPQRFGGKAYSRIDPDASSVRFDSRFISLGASTGNEWIGPATEYPFLLGTNAPGFPHVFVGTGEPLNLWLAQVEARVMWGKLYQSDFSPVSGSTRYISSAESGTIRLMASTQIVFLPRGIPGFELGFARFIHVPYRVGDPTGAFWRKPFKAFFLKNEYAAGDTTGADNQLASVFFRWVFPHSGFELFGERGYEDQFYDLRDFIQDPDNEREYMLGFQKTLLRSNGVLDVLKAEVLNYQLPTLARVRVQGFVYVHGTLRQGHTNRGQLLGAGAGVGAAAASTISWTRYSPRGSSTFLLRRIVRDEPSPVFRVISPSGSDVTISAGAQRMRFGRHVDFGGTVELMEDYNHNFTKDVPNLNFQLTARLHSR
ncbi:MAG: hypothetical protein ACJ8AK_10445 [Gemmatimonadaceae bacterium]